MSDSSPNHDLGSNVQVASTIPIEQDTADSEDIPNLFEFLLPGDISTYDQFSLSYNRKLFAGWVKQPSPCCGAASLAGIYNGLRNIGRNDSLAVTHADVMKVYIHIFVEMIDRKQKSFERRLGCKSMDSFLEQLRLHIETIRAGDIEKSKQTILPPQPQSLDAVVTSKLKKKPLFTKKLVILALKELARQHMELKEPCSVNDGDLLSKPNDPLVYPSALELMLDLMQSSGIVLTVDSSENGLTTMQAAAVDTVDIDADAASDSEDGSDGAGEDQPGETATKAAGRARVPSIWNWQKDLLDILKNISGLEKLRARLKPSTAAIGNWAVVECVKKMADYASIGSGLEARLFMGKKVSSKQKIDFPLTKKDTAEVVSAQWDALRSVFCRPDTAILFHLTNHYAVIYALREWVCDSAVSTQGQEPLQQAPTTGSRVVPVQHTVRQLLTARKGQRPTVWMDFEEARNVMLGWEGYKMIAVKRNIEEHIFRSCSISFPEDLPVPYHDT